MSFGTLPSVSLNREFNGFMTMLSEESSAQMVVTRREGKVSTFRELILPGEGLSGSRCGELTGGKWVCDHCGTVINKRHECGSAECPNCRVSWISRQTKEIREKIKWGIDYFGNPRHYSLNPEPELWDMPERKLREYVFRQCKSRKGGKRWLGGKYEGKWIGLKGGFATFHAFRWYCKRTGKRVKWRWNAQNPDAIVNITKDRAEYLGNMKGWWGVVPPEEPIETIRYYAPHYHVLAWGALPFQPDLATKGIGYVNHDGKDSRGRDDIGGTVWYALSHCSIEKSSEIEEVVYTDKRTGLQKMGRKRSRSQAYWYFGVMGNACVKTEKYQEKEIRECPNCGLGMRFITDEPFYQGDGIHILVTKRHYKFKENAMVTIEDWQKD